MKIIPIYFSISLFFGFLIVYLLKGDYNIIIKKPIKDLKGKLDFVDNNNVCYKYHKKDVLCPFDTKIKTILN